MSRRVSLPARLFPAVCRVIAASCLVFAVCLSVGCQSAIGDDGQRSVRVLQLEGSPYDRGLLHGRELKEEIHLLVGRWKSWLARTYQQDPDEFIGEFLKRTDFKPAIEKWTPGLLDEVRGIADGAELPFDTVYAFQLIDEIWAQGRATDGNHCTAIGISRQGTQPTCVAQNLDIPLFYHGNPTLLRIKHQDSKVESLVFTLPGLVGANGLNNNGIAVAVNTLLQLNPSSEGLPVAFVVRGILQNAHYDKAVEFAKTVQHASGQNYTIGGADDVISLECSANKTARFQPAPGKGLTFHTNHPLANDDFRLSHLRKLDSLGRTSEQGTRDCLRYQSLKDRLLNSNEINIELVRQALQSRDHTQDPICHASTYGCTLMVLSQPPYLLLAPGRPDKHEFQKFGFQR